jgi:GntR family transcriptional regulator, transcriptional repressor for pyruvate dehydrogenase complex
MPDRSAARLPARPRPESALPISNGEAVTRQLKTSESVARDVVHDIVSRGLKTGDRLPAEAAMLEQYGVSRESLREGLRLLEVQGLISIRRGPGGGPTVGHLDPANLGRTSTLYYHLAGGTYEELFEAWILTESILADRAARNADRDAVREAMEPFVDGDDHGEDEGEGVTGFVVAHTHFHGVIAALAENRVLELLLQTIGQIVTHHVVMNADPRAVRKAVTDDHAAVARAIAAGHANKASREMEDHIEHMIAFYRGQLGGQSNDLIDWR